VTDVADSGGAVCVAIIDDTLTILAKRYKHDHHLKISIGDVVDILLDVRSLLGAPQTR